MFYEQFIALCERDGVKPTPLIKQLGFSAGNIKRWENGATVNSDILLAVSKHFKVSIDYLLKGEENQTPPSASSAKYVDMATYNANVNKATGDNISQNINMTLSSQNSISNDIAIELDTLINELEDEKIRQLLIAQVSSSIENFRPFSSKKKQS